MRRLTHLAISVILCMMLIGNAFAQKEQTYRKEFKAKANLDINLVSGDCIIEVGGSDVIKVNVKYSVSPKGSFEPVIKESSNTLKLKGKWHGSSSGNVTWTITVPAKTEVEFSSASGDLSVEGIMASVEGRTASGDISISNSKGDFELKTASGDIEAENIKGEFEFKTASGDLDIKDASGSFDLSCASGDIEASDVTIIDEGSFSTASGDVEVSLAKTPTADVELSAASGDVTLDYQGNQVKGSFELSARKSKGKIRSDMAYDSEKEFQRSGRTYVRKMFTIGSDSPMILLQTASGNVTFKK